jgi:anti-anti-sigma factor
MSSDIKITIADNVATFKILGRLDFSLLRKDTEIAEAISLTDRLIVDYTDCEYIDSTGLGTLLTIRREAESRPNYRIQFYGCNELVKDALDIVGFTKLFEFV